MSPDRARRWYRRALALAPPRLRRRHGAAMEELFLDALARHADGSPASRAWCWTRALGDLLWASLREPFRRPARTHPHSPARPMLGQDLQSAWRAFRRQRASTALVVTMLALGIAANMIVFSLMNALVLRPLPFPDADRLVFVNETAPTWNLDIVGVNYPDFWAWHEHATSFEALAMYSGASFNLSDERGAERIAAGMFTRDYPRVLGVEFIVGRTFTAEEDAPKGPAVVILSERLWRERFQADRGVIGQTLRLSGTTREIVGVLPARAEFPDEAALWVPYQGDPHAVSQSYGGSAAGRLKPGVSVAQAQADLRRAHEPIWAARDRERVVSPIVRPLREHLIADAAPVVAALGVAVGLLLVVTCANVASVLLARAIARRREMGIRLAVGAGRGRLMRQLFLEHLLLSSMAGVAGVLAGRWGLALLLASLDRQVPRWAEFTMDARTTAFALGLTVATALLFGWAPALHALRGNLRAAMQDSVAGTTTSPRGRRTLTMLLGLEFALAAVLLVGGGLLLRAFDRVSRTDPGFRTNDVLTFRLALPNTAYPDDPARQAFWDRALTALSAHPGVQAAGLISCPPLGCHQGMFFKAEGQPPRKAGEPNPVVLTRMASDGYFDAMGIRLTAGRAFEARDRQPDAQRVAIVNEAFVRTFWPGQAQPIGRHISFANDGAPEVTVIGITQDIKHYGLDRPMRPGVYLPISWPGTAALTVAVRTVAEPNDFTGAARALVAGLDRDLPIYQVQTMEAALDRSLRIRAVYSWMLAVFAMLGLTLAIGGAYGVTAYLVSQRTREIGIRLAIGARPPDILRAVLRSGAPAIAGGAAVGVLAAVLLAGQLESLLFDVSPRDPLVAAGASVALMVAAFVATWIPARRAASADPVTSLR